MLFYCNGNILEEEGFNILAESRHVKFKPYKAPPEPSSPACEPSAAQMQPQVPGPSTQRPARSRTRFASGTWSIVPYASSITLCKMVFSPCFEFSLIFLGLGLGFSVCSFLLLSSSHHRVSVASLLHSSKLHTRLVKSTQTLKYPL